MLIYEERIQPNMRDTSHHARRKDNMSLIFVEASPFLTATIALFGGIFRGRPSLCALANLPEAATAVPLQAAPRFR
jgi:hypothetical protein